MPLHSCVKVSLLYELVLSTGKSCSNGFLMCLAGL